VDKADYGWEDEAIRGSVKGGFRRLNDFCFATQNKHQSAPHIANVERLVVLIQHEDG
jgi:hypothetical protein